MNRSRGVSPYDESPFKNNSSMGGKRSGRDPTPRNNNNNSNSNLSYGGRRSSPPLLIISDSCLQFVISMEKIIRANIPIINLKTDFFS